MGQHSTTSLPWIVLQPESQVSWLPMSPLAPWESDWQTVALRTLKKTGEKFKQNYAQGASTFISRRWYDLQLLFAGDRTDNCFSRLTKSNWARG